MPLLSLRNIFKIPKPRPVYDRLIARYPVGSVQYAAFSEAWLAVINHKYMDLYQRRDALPHYNEEYRAGRISQKEYMRLCRLNTAILQR